jgi:hypothetical protein
MILFSRLWLPRGFSTRETCDKCGIVLGAVRFTWHGESEVYCARECRGDAQRSATHRRGRPRKYKTERERRTAKTRQRQVYRSHPSVEKNCPYSIRNKELADAKSASLVLGYSGTRKTAHFEPANVHGDRAKTRVAHPSARTAGGGLRVGWSPKEKWQITKIVREVLLSRGLLSI